MQDLDLGSQPEGGKGATSLLGGHHSTVQARHVRLRILSMRSRTPRP